ncbi:MAG: gamma-glutamylcyclotransferase [Bacilli bacterium]|nr:gamma-glutamylcyclotransferase [Bacilli bacterium]
MARYYLAYGSNLNVTQMRFRCPTAKVVGIGSIKGYRLLFKGSRTGSYLTIEKAKGHAVPVAVWRVDEECERSLDRYEGFPDFYYKKEMEIDFVSIKSKAPRHEKAFVYIMHEERELGIPSRHYVDVCLQGYRAFGFNALLIEEAILKSMEVKGNG